LAGTNDWTELKMNNISFKESPIIIVLMIEGKGTENGAAWFDNISIEKSTKNPEPQFTKISNNALEFKLGQQTDFIAVNPDRNTASYKSSLGNITCDGLVCIVGQDDSIQKFVLQKGKQLKIDEQILLESNLDVIATYWKDSEGIKAEVVLPSDNSIVIYNEGFGKISVNGNDINLNQNSEQLQKKMVKLDLKKGVNKINFSSACGNGVCEIGETSKNCLKDCPVVCIDQDNDQYGEDCKLGKDCNDLDPKINPGMKEVCGDGQDNDCNGEEDENCVDFVTLQKFLAENQNKFYGYYFFTDQGKNEVYLGMHLKESLIFDFK